MLKFNRYFIPLFTPLIAVLLAFLVSSVLLLAIDKNPIAVFQMMFSFALGRSDSIGMILFNATPLIFSGLAVAFGFKVGLFNIGVEGQYLIGAFCAAWVGFTFTGLSPVIHLPMAVLAALAGGAFWSFLPIMLRVKRGIHEVISTIMLNYIAYSLIHYVIAEVYLDRNQNIPAGLGSPLIRTPKFAASVFVPKMHALFGLVGIDLPAYVYLNWFFIVGLFLAAAVWYVLYKTPFGYEIRAVGGNAQACQAAGINPSAIYFKVFLISGAMAGMTGLSHLLGFYEYMDLDFPKNLGFNGIAVALMGNNNPYGIILAAMLLGFLSRGAEGIQAYLGVPMESGIIMQGIMIISVVIAASILAEYQRGRGQEEGK